VEVVVAVVAGEGVFDSVEGEAAFADAVAVAADDRAEVGVLLEVAVQGVEAEDDSSILPARSGTIQETTMPP